MARRAHPPAAAAAAALALAALVGCSPDIGNGTYFCGPERLCPPDQECNDNTYTCESPRLAERFECPAGSTAAEPDDTAAEALDVGAITCGAVLVEDRRGCIGEVGDVDLIAFELVGACVGDRPHMEAAVRFPIALVPLRLELLDEEGAVIDVAEVCTVSGDATGTERLCIDAAIEPGRYLLRVQAEPDGPDCDGDCHHNQYTIEVTYPLA
ncbi:MAG TPA: hypothetical protein VKZ63_16705 [Kofleriaceae bacterium]|nr:hypothetical protein [Kofleriaceae bacterium]